MTQFRTRFRTGGLSYRPAGQEPPLRSELFSADQLEQYGKTLAAAHKVTLRWARDHLLTRLAANEDALIDVCNRLTATVSPNDRITPAGEWLLDNFYLIEEQIGTAKRHFPRGYSRELPRLALGPSKGLPRVYDIALEMIAHGDGRVDAESLSRFVAAYQTVVGLQLGELWAIPIMLRLALIENLRRVGVRLATDRAERDLANTWADQLMETAEKDPKNLIVVIADMARSTPPMGSAFVAEFARRLQGQSPALALALTWMEQQLAESHLTIEQLVQTENQQQAADQVSLSNSIGSLRFLSAIDWRTFVETMSVVEKVLRQDPNGVYGAMDFATRDRYRHVTERIAKEGRLPEAEVAAKAIALARASAADKSISDRAGHVGFYLIDSGLPELERAAGVDVSIFGTLRRIGGRLPLPLYLGSIAVFSGALTAGLVANANVAGAGVGLLLLVTVLSLLATSQLAVATVNWLATLLVTPHSLPRMDFSAGIVRESRTLVVVPTMLTSARGVEELVEALEVRFLANRDRHVHFGLLTDFPDAHEESLPTDEPLLRLAETRINELNRTYRPEERHGPASERRDHDDADHAATDDMFFLFHRPRRWNPQERVWMGYERKRGKLGDLNALLRGDHRDGFSLIVGNTAILSQVKYVITLDTDTQLPRDSARQLVGTMAHPLNRACFDETGTRAGRDIVAVGYGILQPRVSASLPGTRRSRYARLFGGDPGLDPYTRTVSDVYQDVFGEGSFVGKGIYDVDAFERALKARFPENRILSHDLLEGCYARAGLVSDSELYEEFPARYTADVARRHRWIRGDWQLVGWLRRRVRGHDGRREHNPLSWLSQWKIVDNLRRSLAPAAVTVLLLLGWTLFSGAWFWTAAIIGILLLPAIGAVLADLLDKPVEVGLGQHLGAVERSAVRHFAQALFGLACLPYEAFFCLDAVMRTLWRMLVTQRRLLEWNTSSEVERELDQSNRTDLLASYRSMWIAPTIAALAWVGLSAARPATLAIAGPILLLWAASPAIAWWVSRPLARRSAKLTVEQTHFLRKLARRTWAYFEIYVGPDDHWLPPDNVQEQPTVTIAHRTSPTNMGLALLANLTAHDFGYLSTAQLILRTTNALRTMESLERYRRHFYNWYDTQTLVPLVPTYVSTVDSGNLAAHLLTLRPGLIALTDAPILAPRWLEGLSDTFALLLDTVGGELAVVAHFEQALESAVVTPPATLITAWLHVEQLATCAVDVAAHFADDPALGPENEAALWSQALSRQCAELRDELLFLAPWLSLPLPEIAPDFPGYRGIPTLREIAAFDASSLPIAERSAGNDATVQPQNGLADIRQLVTGGASRARARIISIGELALQASDLATMNYDFLFDKVRRQLVIGYNAGEHRCDSSYYDLLASEARLCNFVAIAQGELPQESWFALGRLLTSAGGEPVLLSWSGSMFEYLMPQLVMPTYENTLLDQTCVAAVTRQIEYGRERGVPWGISECGYNTVDIHLNYQYRGFGVPGLGLKRGLSEDLVVAPYASALALMVAPEAACQNLQRLAADGLAGRLGLFEAVDYTPSRQRRGESSAVVRSFMAHHQGMSLLAFAYVMLARPMQKRFVSDPLFQATLLLLQERIPRATAFHASAPDASELRVAASSPEMPVRVLASPDTAIPEVQLLSNGRYHVMVNNAGGGSSRWKDLAVTRWREDITCDDWGTFCYLRDVASGEFWSTAHQPTLKRADHYEAIFSEGRAEFRRRDFDLETHTEIVVSPEDDIELRRVHITNRSRTRRTIDVTSYAEVVLAPAAADALHPAFSNLFVQTEIIHGRHAILCTRRPRSVDEHVPWMFHLMTVQGAGGGAVSFETDRMRFIGRGGSVATPIAMIDPGALSDTEGSVLDPIAAIRHRLTLDAGASATIDVVSGMGETRDAVLSLVEKYQDHRLADRVFELTWTHSQVVLRQLNTTEADSQLYSHLASSVIYANASMRAAGSVLVRNRRGQSGLWGYAISGDLPIVLLQIADIANIDVVRQLVHAHAYWRLKGLAVDLVIWNEDHDVYRQRLQEQIMGLIAAGVEAHVVDRPGGIFVRIAEQISPEDRILIQSVARVIITDSRGTLASQISRRVPAEVRIPRLVPTRTHRPETPSAAELPREPSILFNGIGGFTPDGREYVIAPAAGQTTPVPWVNVLANPHFGTVVSESGVAYTWSENAHLFRLTPWHNDPVGESSGEALYLRDEESGHFWSPASPYGGGAEPYVSRHGFGYSVFEHVEDGIRSELTVFVALDAAVKFSSLKVSNQSGRPRRLSATGYVEWVLGDLRAKSAMHVTTEIDSRNGALYARNPYNNEFADWVGFFDVDDATRSVTADRTEFLGRNGMLRDPAAMYRTRLSGKVGAGLDPCAAIQVAFDLADGQEREITFRLGAARNADAAGPLVQRFRGTAIAREALEAVVGHWRHTLGAVQVDTPDAALNVLTNGWLVYQTMACRLWARSGYYQSGGAYGFRDQLQDVMALVHAEPSLVRAQIALCASRQFVEGDVQHWWHPPSGRGVRTHCSDDYLWLPLATCRYVLTTGDMTILDETAHFLEGRPVHPDDDSYYDLPGRSDESASVYQHCARAIVHGLRFGVHGLPLIGSGDWNDGMNLVGRHGKGESVWLAFFLCHVLGEFAKLARLRDDRSFADRCETEATQLRQRIEQNAWDGEWYRRAYFDDGSPLGSMTNPECQIDSVSQSWSVLSGASDIERARRAMNAVYARLVRGDHALIQLLDPPFDRSDLDPGYIRGYVPGVRENGGQYTHGAIWTAMAFAALGDSARAWELMGMINPVNHARTAEGAATYMVEPYVVAADVYALAPHTGRGGWTWYTGSAGWMYRLIVESLLGLRLQGDRLYFAPCFPAKWKEFKLRYRYRQTHYHIAVRSLEVEGDEETDTSSVTIDGVTQHRTFIVLVDDRREHRVEVRVASRSPVMQMHIGA
ncbi:MAG: cyclic beta 1-2 glucan synthetase [Pseudomonadota bacterium]|nr:cyclic beta 1-2 glucan synthetase [Pseudomonadota bacterium]